MFRMVYWICREHLLLNLRFDVKDIGGCFQRGSGIRTWSSVWNEKETGSTVFHENLTRAGENFLVWSTLWYSDNVSQVSDCLSETYKLVSDTSLHTHSNCFVSPYWNIWHNVMHAHLSPRRMRFYSLTAPSKLLRLIVQPVIHKSQAVLGHSLRIGSN